MRFFKMLIVASLVAVATIEAWPYVAAAHPTPAPRRGARLARMRENLVERITAPLSARAERHSRSHVLWR